MSADTDHPVEYYYFCALTFLGHLLKERVRFPFGTGRTPVRPQLYSLIVQPSGKP
jgi:hypothetical protein